MKRAPYTYGLKPESAVKQWRSLEEFAGSKELEDAVEREFPAGASELSGVSRRGFIGLMGASLGLAGLAGCRRPEEKILPYNKRPEYLAEGKALYYSTTMSFYGTAIGLIVESHEGRPTKIDGNPRHPESGSKSGDGHAGTTAFVQAAILDLYDVDRSEMPHSGGKPADWDSAVEALKALGAAAKQKSGKGLAILTEAQRSPTVQAQLDELKKQMPQATVTRYEPFGRANVREGARIAFGRPYDMVTRAAQARVFFSVGSDFLNCEGNPIKNARGYGEGRTLTSTGSPMNRLYVVESTFSVTGAVADHRMRARAGEMHDVLLGLAAAVGVTGVPQAQLDDTKRKFVSVAARDLAANRGASLVVAGEQLPPAAHAVAHLINLQLGNVGHAVDFVPPFSTDAEGPGPLTLLAQQMKRGEIDTLIILGGNPAYNAPADADFGAAMAKVAKVVHLSSHVDETSALAGWHLPRAHFLEAWGDVRAEDGTASIIQPMIAPLKNGRTDAEVLERFLGGNRTAYQLVTQTWQQQGGLVFNKTWRRALHDGVLTNTAWEVAKVSVAVDAAAIGAVARATGLEVTFHPDMHAWDGRFANNSWMQELPDQMTKLTWDNAALLSPATAKKLGVSEGDLLDISVGAKKITIAALPSPGQAEDSIALTIGLGRKAAGSVGNGTGFDTTPLRTTNGFGSAGAVARAAGGTYKLAHTQTQDTLHTSIGSPEDRAMIRASSLVKWRKDPKFVESYEDPHPPLVSLFPDWKYEGHKWGMVIDLTTCIGCNACMVACQAENNIPVVGKENVGRGRSMHWIRIDRYYTGENQDEPQAAFQPLGCQHCENAPCEQVCPVGATTHSPEGLNDIAYNRCIGTRYCANNCPYKVRRFNFFNYTKDMPELKRMQSNPDVTVRFRGVIEKCSYCVQRITQAKIAAHKRGEERVKDGAIISACQASCPTEAIVFGDLNDKDSKIAKLVEQPRQYKLLEELNVKPRTSFLARIRNPNPELA